MSWYGRSPRTVLVIAIIGVSACAWWRSPADSLRPKAAIDLDCPEDHLRVSPVAGDCGGRARTSADYECTLRVSGCGKQATYTHLPGTKRWVEDSAGGR